MSECVPFQQLATMTGSVPRYSGQPSEDIEEWIFMFELMASSKNLDEQNRKLHLLWLLIGEAKIFFNFIGGNNLPVDDCLKQLKARFEKGNRSHIWNQINILDREPDESWAGFLERYVVLARKLNIPEEIQLDWIKDKLPQSVNIVLATFQVADVSLNITSILGVLRSDALSKLDTGNSAIAVVSKRSDERKMKRHKKNSATTISSVSTKPRLVKYYINHVKRTLSLL